MDTESIKLFVLAAERLNISAAGRELGMAPAVASARLAKLEKLLGADLLRRSTRKVALSLEGAEFLPFAREILAQERAALAAMGQGEASPGGTLRFTAPSTFSQLYIAPILPGFLARYPDLTLDLRLTDMQFDLIDGSFDLALRNAALTDSGLHARKLADDTRILCAAPAYLAQRGTPRQPDELDAHSLIAFRQARPVPLRTRDGRNAVFNPRKGHCRLVVDDGLSQKLVTVQGAGISINSLWSVQAELASGSLVRVLPEFAVAEDVALWLVYPRSNVLTAKVRVLIDYLIEQLSGVLPAGDAA